MLSSSNPLKSGRFYSIYEASDYLVMEDLTKRGLEIRDKYFDTKYSAECDSGVIYDGGGRGYKVGVRWYFPKSKFILDEVVRFGENMDQRYQAIREETCPDD